MTEVLNIPRDPDGTNLYTSTLRRSPPSSSSLFLDSSPTASLSVSPRISYTPPGDPPDGVVTSPPSSLSSSPLTSHNTLSETNSILSTPASSGHGSFDDILVQGTDDIDFPNYDNFQFYHSDKSFEPQDESSDESVDEALGLSTATDTTRSDSPLHTPTVVDDTAVNQEPSRHVDYLSHDWREEDIWSSWRHIVSQRKVYGQRSRLENASWRTWAKSKYRLSTVSPETLNWLKESDVTWLYGPLKPASSHPITQGTGSGTTSHISKNNSFINKKPILKKRTMSEVMLQKSLSATSLVKQAAASAQAQQGVHARRRSVNDGRPIVAPSRAPSEVPSRDPIDYFTSRSTSSGGTPCECHEKKHIRFDETVEQCIAVDAKDGDFDDDEECVGDSDDEHITSDSSSDDGLLMMRRKKRPGARPGLQSSSRASSYNNRKIIETLPATKLKSRVDSPDSTQEARHHTFGRSWGSKLSPSPSQETLRPSNPSKNFLIRDESAVDDGASSSWSFGASNPRSSLGEAASNESLSDMGRRRRRNTGAAPVSSVGLGDSPEGMRRTPSGMFMPYDEDEDDAMAVGLFGRVSETINTARDIAHVIWNVGWRN